MEAWRAADLYSIWQHWQEHLLPWMFTFKVWWLSLTEMPVSSPEGGVTNDFCEIESHWYVKNAQDLFNNHIGQLLSWKIDKYCVNFANSQGANSSFLHNMRGRKEATRSNNSKKQEISGENGRKALKVPPAPTQVEKRKDVKWRKKKGACTMHAINFFKRHKLPLNNS